MDKEIVYRVEDGMDREKILCTTYQMRNFYMQFRDGFFTNLDVMNYIQHLAAAHMAKKGMNVLDVCCGRSLMLPLLRYYAKDIASYTGVDISKANIKEAMRGATAKNLEPKDLASYYPFRVGWKLGNVAEMSKVIPAGFADFVIYTSAIEHALQKQPDELAEFSQQAASNLNTAETVASAIGAQASSMIQDAIRDEDWTPNAPITVEGGWMVNEYGKNGPVPVHIDGKGSTKPLIDTGTMRQQCGFRLVKGEK